MNNQATLSQKIRAVSAIALGSLTLGILGQTASVQAAPSNNDAAAERLAKMFSPKVRAVMNACDRQGEVNLAVGADRDGSVICGNGWRKSAVQYSEYSEVATDLLAAFMLTSLRSVVQAPTPEKTGAGKPEAGKPEAIMAIFKSPEAKEKFGKSLQEMWRSMTGTTLPNEHRDRILQKTYAMLNDTQKFNTLLGTGAEYNLVVENFCSPKGQTLKAAKQIVPKLNAIQMYSICINEAGFK